MRKLILVRHSLPHIDPQIPARQWRLSETGRTRCLPLARDLEAHQPTRIVSSLEPKAIETGQIVAERLGLPFNTYEGLHEHDRSNVDFMDKADLNSSVARLFQRPDQMVYGKETADQAHFRFAGMVAEVMQLYGEGNIAIVAHGTVIALFVARAAGIEPLPVWKRLGLPSFAVLSLPGPRLITVNEGIGY